jgi:hypothetical protein
MTRAAINENKDAQSSGAIQKQKVAIYDIRVIYTKQSKEDIQFGLNI